MFSHRQGIWISSGKLVITHKIYLKALTQGLRSECSFLLHALVASATPPCVCPASTSTDISNQALPTYFNFTKCATIHTT